ncbi:gliding motility protein GldB [Nonlabens ulvanivorans]|nr:gliding motility lipoprotein GldB [Nonlabens ulvanivorans]GAK93704.1 gliding motility protein GldB [Nonlabens ulvanivorans]
MKYKIYRGFKYLAFAKALFILSSCNDSSRLEQEIAAIPIQSEIKLFHEEFALATPDDLNGLKQKYSMLFPQRFADSVWIAKLTGTDTIQTVLENAVNERKFDYQKIHEEVDDVFRHVEFYFPEFETPDIVTVISQVDYRRKVTPTEEQLLIAIDTYLGNDHELYAGISAYQKEGLQIEHLPADVGLAYAYLFVQPSMDRSLLGSMVYHGKLHYLQELFAPQSTGAQIFNYAPEKFDFVVNNESQMWSFFVDENLLYNTNPKLQSRFILPAPFSKFYLEVDQDTPGGVGQYIGYRMVKAYMENNDTPLDAMLTLPADVIFNKSGYKPKQ